MGLSLLAPCADRPNYCNGPTTSGSCGATPAASKRPPHSACAHDATVRSSDPATRPRCSPRPMPLLPEACDRVPLYPALQPNSRQGSARWRRMAASGKVRRLSRAGPQGGLACCYLQSQWANFTDRFPSIAQVLHELPAKAAVLDGEVAASNADGSPNFARLHVRWARPGAIRLSAFDLLAFNGRDLRLQPMVKAPGASAGPVRPFRLSRHLGLGPFEDAVALLRVAAQRGLEGVVTSAARPLIALGSAGICARWRRWYGARPIESNGASLRRRGSRLVHAEASRSI
jgi:hypothetical protein